MKKIIVGLASLAIALLPFQAAFAYSHANAYGGSTSHSYAGTSHTNAYGGTTTHAYGEGTTHSSDYGTSTTHYEGGGTTHTNAYGGTTSGEAGYGAVHTGAYGATAYHPPDAYYGYHPPTTAAYYGGSGCYNCAAGAAVAGAAVVGATVATAAVASTSAANSQAAYAAGYNAGATTAAVAYAPGQIVAVLPAGCATPTVNGQTYYLCGNTWFSPSYGANGVYYRVVPTP